jgi:hypothetical protein
VPAVDKIEWPTLTVKNDDYVAYLADAREVTDPTAGEQIDFERGASDLNRVAGRRFRAAVACSDSLVETTVIKANHGWVIPLINWGGRPAKNLSLKLSMPKTVGANAKFASGLPVRREGDCFIFDLDVGDGLVLRGRDN